MYYPALTKPSKSSIKKDFAFRLSINDSSAITTAITEWYWTLRDRLESNVVVDFSCKNTVWELRSPKWPPKFNKSKLQIHLAYFWNQNLKTLLCAINSSRCVDIFCKKNQQQILTVKKITVDLQKTTFFFQNVTTAGEPALSHTKLWVQNSLKMMKIQMCRRFVEQ